MRQRANILQDCSELNHQLWYDWLGCHGREPWVGGADRRWMLARFYFWGSINWANGGSKLLIVAADGGVARKGDSETMGGKGKEWVITSLSKVVGNCFHHDGGFCWSHSPYIFITEHKQNRERTPRTDQENQSIVSEFMSSSSNLELIRERGKGKPTQ